MKNAVLIIDMLNDFVLPGAPLEVPETRSIINNIQNRVKAARDNRHPIIYVCDNHAPDDPEFSRMGWPPHAVRETEGAQVIGDLAPQEMDPIIHKTSYSGFLHTGLDGLLQSLKINHLILTGCVTNICILYTAYDAVVRGYDVTVPADAVANLDPGDGAFALKQMTEVLGVKVV